jgi:hypothetical protein
MNAHVGLRALQVKPEYDVLRRRISPAIAGISNDIPRQRCKALKIFRAPEQVYRCALKRRLRHPKFPCTQQTFSFLIGAKRANSDQNLKEISFRLPPLKRMSDARAITRRQSSF